MKGVVRLEEMTSTETNTFKGVILPLGSLEQHGQHLPLGTDGLIARGICEEVASRKNLALCPTLFFGFSGEHSGFPGTIDLDLGAFTAVVERLIQSLQRSFSKIFVINFHGGNSSASEALVKEMNRHGVYLIHFWRAAHEIMKSMTLQRGLGMEHAGEFETSLMLFLRPELVRKGQDLGSDQSIPLKGGRVYTWAWHSEEMTPTGTFGGAKWASREKGREFFQRSCSRLSEIIDEIREGSGEDRLERT